MRSPLEGRRWWLAGIGGSGMSGYALAQELRSLYYGSPDAPLLIAISGKWVKASDQMLARLVGFAHHLMKPCDPNQLLELIAPLQKISHP